MDDDEWLAGPTGLLIVVVPLVKDAVELDVGRLATGTLEAGAVTVTMVVPVGPIGVLIVIVPLL